MSRVWEGSQHKGSALLQLLAIADYADDNGLAWPGLSTLAGKTRISRRQVMRINEACQESGELWIIQRERRQSNLYVVTLGLTSDQLEDAMQRALDLGAELPQGSDKLSPPPQVLEVVTKCHHLEGGGDIHDTTVVTPMTPRSDIAMSPDPSLTVNEPSEKEKGWKAVKEALQGQTSKATFDQWLASSELIRATDDTWTVRVAHKNAIAWLERLGPTIERTMAHYAPGVRIEFTTERGGDDVETV